MAKPAKQYQPYLRPYDVWTLTLDRYERDNLLNLLQNICDQNQTPVGNFNNGDWVYEIRYMLGKLTGEYQNKGLFDIDEEDHPNPVHGYIPKT